MTAILVAGILLYFFWYQNPDKVVTDGIRNALTARSVDLNGVATIESRPMRLTFAVATKSSGESGSLSIDIKARMLEGSTKGHEFTVKADSAVIKDGTLYVKVANLKVVVDAFIASVVDSQQRVPDASNSEARAQARQQLAAMVDPVVKRLDNRWIKLTPGELTAAGGDQCLADVLTTLRREDSNSKELADIYQNNKFITVDEKLGIKNNSQGYRLNYDRDAATKFVQAAKSTKFAQKLEKCNVTLSKFRGDDIQGPKSFELWIDQWTHQITRIVINDKTDDRELKIDATTKFNIPVLVDTPQNAISLQELQQDGGNLPIQPLF